MIEKILERLRKARETQNVPVDKDYWSWVGAISKCEEIVQEVAKEYGGGWIPCSSGQMPTECEEVNVTIEDDEGALYTTTSWMQDGVWVVKKTALHPKVIAWKPKDAPYQKGE